jgi:hypothetical protein
MIMRFYVYLEIKKNCRNIRAALKCIITTVVFQLILI